MVVVDAVVVGVTGSAQRPGEVVLARRDESGGLHRIGLSLPLPPLLSPQLGARVKPTGEPPMRVSTALFGRGPTEYHPVAPELVVEIEAEPAITRFANRLRPRVHRLRPDLNATELGTQA